MFIKRLLVPFVVAVVGIVPSAVYGAMLIDEGFEGVGAPSGWSGSPGVNYDYTTLPLAGSESLHSDAAEYFFAPLPANESEIWGSFLYRADSLRTSAASRPIQLQDSSYTTLCQLYVFADGSATADFVGYSSAGSFVAGTGYTIWYHYQAGPGGVCEFWWDEGADRATASQHLTQAVSGTAQVDHFLFIQADNDGDAHVGDAFKVADTDEFAGGGDVTAPVISSVASSTTASGATITWTTDEAATSRVFFGVTSSYTDSTAQGSATTTNHSVPITGLDESTLYHFAVVSRDDAGNYATSTDYTFTTASGATAPTIVTSAASSLTTTTATLNGSISSTGGASLTEHGFAYATSSSLTANVSTTTLGANSSTGAFQSPVTSLACNTSYYARAYGTNSQGTSYGSIETFTTSACAPTIATQSASSVTVGSAELNGSVSATGGASVTTRGFAYGLTTAYGATTTESGSFSTGAYSASVSPLVCNTLYHVRAYATNSSGTSYGSDDTFTTSACASPALTTSAASSVSTAGATLNGSISSTGGASSLQAGFAYGTSIDLSSAIATTTSLSVSAAQSVPLAVTGSISSLTCATQYYFRAYATNGVGTTFGSIQSFTTSACPAAAASTASVATSGSSSARRAAMLASVAAQPVQATALIQPIVLQGASGVSSSGILPVNLFLGQTDLSVMALQRVLNADPETRVAASGNGSPGRETSYFGKATQEAVKRFQAKHGLVSPSDAGYGIVGPITRAKLSEVSSGAVNGPSSIFASYNPAITSVKETAYPKAITVGLAFGMIHPAVITLQVMLNADVDTRVAASGRGSPGSETTYFGKATQEAVKRFQEKHGLATSSDPAYGYVGPTTRAKLNELFASLIQG